ncbi:PadR family transcriptional regulator [Luteitalea pratensis]|uniref:PadR family transcriptional regulator n=1 Tax=Luteitalea pratensis TaxID=1855912 RepID=UPI003AAC3379
MRTIALEPLHGWAIAQRIQQISDDLLRVQQGSLYPALHRLEHQGWITAEWGASENNRRARFYALTKAGRKQLEAKSRSGSACRPASTSSCNGRSRARPFALPVPARGATARRQPSPSGTSALARSHRPRQMNWPRC